MGIANATSLHRTHVSRTLEALAREGLVNRGRARVSGFGRTLLVFALTDTGRRASSDLGRNLSDLVVDVVGTDGSPRRERLEEVVRRSTRGLGMWDVVRGLEHEGGLHVGAANVPSPRTFVREMDDAPVVADFVGRSQERHQLAKWLADPGASCLIEGAGGIGKSMLVAQTLQEVAPPRHVLWLRLTQDMSPTQFLVRLAGFFARIGRPLPSSSNERVQALVEQLPTRLRSLPLVFVLDDVHKADTTLQRAFEGLAREAQRPGGLKIIWIGRTLRLPIDALRRAVRIELAPLTLGEREALLAARAVPARDRSRLAERSGGNPLFLELLATGGSEAAAQEGLVRYLRQGVWESSSSSELEILRHLCVLRAPVTRARLETVVSFKPAALEHLLEVRIVTPVGGGALEIHDEIRDAMYGQLPESERRAIHGRWAACFDPKGGALDTVVEYFHHLCLAGRRSEAAWWAIRNQTALLVWARGRFREAGAGLPGPS